jgi:hypothetical protein
MPCSSGTNDVQRTTRGLTFRDAMLMWHAWEVYRIKRFVSGILTALLVMDWCGATMLLGVVGGTLVVGVHGSIAWGVWRGLRWLVRTCSRRLR